MNKIKNKLFNDHYWQSKRNRERGIFSAFNFSFVAMDIFEFAPAL